MDHEQLFNESWRHKLSESLSAFNKLHELTESFRKIQTISNPAFDVGQIVHQKTFHNPVFDVSEGIRKALEAQNTGFKLGEAIRKSAQMSETFNLAQKLGGIPLLFHKDNRDIWTNPAYIESAKIPYYEALFDSMDGLQERLKGIGTDFIDIDLIPEFESESEEPEVKESQIIRLDETKRLKKIISDVATNKKLMYQLPPRDFEEMVAELLRKQNFDVTLTKRTRDGGYDIIALQSLSGMHNKYLVECKRFGSNNPVGVEIVRSLLFVVQDIKANKGIICTSSYFSADVRRQFKEYLPYQLELRDNNDLLDWISKYK